MDIRTGKKLQETFTKVDILMAALESLSKALETADNRIRQLEDSLQAIELRHTKRNGSNRQ